MDDKPKVEYGVTPTEVMASMAGVDFVRAIFDGTLPAPPIMQTIEPFDSTAEPGVVVMHSIPGFRHYNPIGSVHGGYAATLLDSAMGLAVHSALPAGTGYTTLEIQGLLHQGHDQGQWRGAHRRPDAECRPTRRDRGGAHH
jgi:acyl-coenzyme A thioesterase PaaI-like protein